MSDRCEYFSFRQIENVKTKKPYWLANAHHVKPTHEVINDIVECCNEPIIYHRLFKQRLNSFRFSAEDARLFMRWAQDCEVYLIFSAVGRVVGAIHIIGGVVGFWCSSDHGGCMTPALAEICTLPRRETLTASTDRDNQRCQNVLRANGFERTNDGCLWTLRSRWLNG